MADAAEKPEWSGLSINVRVSHGKHGYYWAVYFGDGDLPGSLWGGAGTYRDPDEAWKEAHRSFDRAFAAHPPSYLAEVGT